MGTIRPVRLYGAAVAATLALVSTAPAQDRGVVHPTKTAFAGWEGWPGLLPGAEPLRNFSPFRAVYARVYRDGQGRRRTDRVIITAERVAWGPDEAVLVTLIDAGSEDFDDTSARIQTRVFAAQDQRLLLQIAPAPGSAKNYLVIHSDSATVRATFVEAATGAGTLQPTNGLPVPQLGAPALWIVGSMPLREGQRIRFLQADTPAPSSILGARPLLVVGQEDVTTVLGTQRAWVVQYPLTMADGRVIECFLIDQPPYLLGKRPRDLAAVNNTDIGTLALIGYQRFERR